ncbi:MAG TPA: Fe-S cluster assembly ATPase SufC [Anaerolineaceae bacterium]|jgi:Fe-S cluster assembly ATP-binding protein|nr:Fe-S cluster assembly ATPase SufC [Anaerolineaceae bacterium]HNZ14465.1 Fe-S cluster assembly ATPase SufC [Anaerolineaceae bacterium]HQL92230.1 Fe-S cluster assembly ATPase SufC [Anaerolineaceae bacterium]HQN68830.1 Fe-S cluster assembly ATPase SufC [Anaerolineaceae bacterium]
MTKIEIKDLHVNIGEKEILKGFNLTVNGGEVHALMGPNGTGKSTLAYALMGHPRYEVIKGDVLLDGESIMEMSVDERARRGLFLAFQYPVAIPGVTLANFLRSALNAKAKALNPEDKGISLVNFRRLLRSKMDLLKMDYAFGARYLNDGFSGGEKKRAEVLQMAMLEPRIAILDETDSGLDIDALRIVADGVHQLQSDTLGVILITHYQRMLEYMQPQFVHIMYGGAIVESGGAELALKLEEQGYDWIRDKYPDTRKTG